MNYQSLFGNNRTFQNDVGLQFGDTPVTTPAATFQGFGDWMNTPDLEHMPMGNMTGLGDFSALSQALNSSPADLGNTNWLSNFGQWSAANTDLIKGIGSLATGLFQGFNSYNQNKLYKQQLETQNNQWNANFDNQRKMVNAQLADRQRARVASNSSYMGVDEYMKKYGV